MADELRQTLQAVLAPLIVSDEGELFLVRENESSVHLHLGGRFAGCPGNSLVITQIIEPLIHSVRPNAQVTVTSGALLPDGSEVIIPTGPAAPNEAGGSESAQSA